MGLIGNLFNFQTPTGSTSRNLFGSRVDEVQQVIEDRIKIENQIEYTDGLMNSSTSSDSKLRRPLIG